MARYITNNASSPQTPIMSSPFSASSSSSSSMKIGSATSTTSAWGELPHAASSRKMSFSSAVIRRYSSDVPSAYISDEDLFGGDEDEPYLSEPPPPPRSAEVWLARPLLPPVVSDYRRRSAPRKSIRKTSKSTKSTK